MWNDMNLVLQSMYPALIVLRLADSNRPSMDRLYFYVRVMDRCIEKVAKLLDEMDDRYSEQEGDNVRSRMLNYFLDNETQVDEFTNEVDKNVSEDVDSDEDNESDTGDMFYDASPSQEEDKVLKDDDSVETVDVQAYRCQLGNKVKDIWEKRRKHLVNEVTRSAWMLSPMPTVMKDVQENHNGEDRLVLEKLFIKWYSHEVTTLFLFFFHKCDTNNYFTYCTSCSLSVLICRSTMTRQKLEKW